jgi:predicted O-methyltransferase YrrM
MNMPIRTWRDIPGWFDDGDAEFVSAICRRVRGGTVVEVGSFAGRSTAAMAPACAANGTKLHAVDLWFPVPPPGTPLLDGDGFDYAPHVREAARPHRSRHLLHAFRRNMKSLGVWGAVVPHQLDAVEAAALFADGSVDFCFVDVGHGHEPTRRVLAAWLPKVRPGGRLGGHDWQARGVRRAARGLGLPVARPRGARHICWTVRIP